MKLGLPSILFVVFLVLKLTGVIAWSWWWVTAPLWGAALLTFVVIVWVGWKVSSADTDPRFR